MKPILSILAITTVLFVAGCASSTPAAKSLSRSIVEANKGAYLVLSGTDQTVTIRIRANDVQLTEVRGLILVDRQILQLQSSRIPNPRSADSLNAVDVLLDHMKSELSHIVGTLKQNISNPRSEPFSSNGREFLYWQYNMATDSASVKAQAYVTTRCFDHIVILNSPIESLEHVEKIKGFLQTTARTLRTYDFNIDLAAFHQQAMSEP